MELELKNTVAFVAGSSRGIGRAIAKAFLREGARVVVTGRNRDRLLEAASLLEREAGPGHVLPVQGDMTNTADIQNAMAMALKSFGPVDAVVANVGTGRAKSGWAVEPSDWQDVLRENLLGSVYLARAALEHMTRKKSGSITFITSIAGWESSGAPITYSAAKAALHSVMKDYARQAGPAGVRVNAVAPGNIFFEGGTWDSLQKEDPDKVDRYIAQEVPMKRFGFPEEIADAVLFLSSARAAFINGACLVVDGGQTRSM